MRLGSAARTSQKTAAHHRWSALVIHSRDDKLFPLPEYGRHAAQWWAACDRCGNEPVAPDAQGCIAYSDCAGDTTTKYCETGGAHTRWPSINDSLLVFFKQARH